MKQAAALKDPLFEALIERLPAAGSPFPVQEQAKWLQAFAVAAHLIYGAPGDKMLRVDVDEATGDIAIDGRNIWTGAVVLARH